MRELNEEELIEMLMIAVQNSIEYFVINKEKEFMAKIPKLQQAYNQIKALIQKPGRDKQLDAQFVRLLEEAKRLGVGEKELIGRALKEYKKKPGVTEEWIEEKAEKLREINIESEKGSLSLVFLTQSQAKDFIRSLVEEEK